MLLTCCVIITKYLLYTFLISKFKEEKMKKEKTVDKPECEETEELSATEEQVIDNEKNQESEEIAEEIDLEFLQTENQRLKEEFLRAYADAENTKKRCAQEIEKNNKYAISSFAKELLSVADNLQRAIDATKDKTDEQCINLLEGVKLTQNGLMKAFNKFGISKMEIMGTIFNPNYHQVIQEIEDKDKPTGTIIAELQTGYMINDRILREAMVIVTKGGKAE